MDYKLYCQMRDYVNPKPTKVWIYKFSKNSLPQVILTFVVLLVFITLLTNLLQRGQQQCLRLTTNPVICQQ